MNTYTFRKRDDRALDGAARREIDEMLGAICRRVMDAFNRGEPVHLHTLQSVAPVFGYRGREPVDYRVTGTTFGVSLGAAPLEADEVGDGHGEEEA